MESQPQNPEFRINPENFHLCYILTCMQRNSEFRTEFLADINNPTIFCQCILPYSIFQTLARQ